MSESEHINCTIDGITVSVPMGSLVIEAAFKAGVMVPHFCYHRLLKPYGGCRMCLVEILRNSDSNPNPIPRLQAACLMQVQPGMIVETKNDRVKAARKVIMEFTLVNHPLDCPVCDKGGECDLQDLAYLYGSEDSRLKDPKMFFPHHALSSLITLDYNRCILCKRCVRWTEEIADDDRLIYMGRGAKTRIATYKNLPFISRFSGMTIDLCPVGALSSKVFRFKARVWELNTINSTCGECATGCAVSGQTRGNRLMRLVSREDPLINGPFLCDRGRFAHDFLDNPNRIVNPIARINGKFVQISWDDAVADFAGQFIKAIKEDGNRAVAACIDPAETLESLWAFSRLFRDVIGTPRVEHAPAPLGLDPDDVLSIASRLASMDATLKSQNLILWESDPFSEAPVFGLRLKLAWEQRKIDGISIRSTPSFLGKHGFDERILSPHARIGVLAGVVNEIASTIGAVPVELQASIDTANKIALTLSDNERKISSDISKTLMQPDAVLIIGACPLTYSRSEISILILIAQLREAAAGSQIAVLPMLSHANSLASLLIGLRTQLQKGRAASGSVAFTGESYLNWPADIEKEKLKAVFIHGDGLHEAYSFHEINSFNKLDYLAVVTDFMTPLAQRANLILPRLSSFENSGTFITLDGMIRRLNRMITHPKGAWPPERFFGEVARTMGSEIPQARSELRMDLAESIPIFRALSDKSSLMLNRPHKIPFRTGASKHIFDLAAPPEKNRFGIIPREPIFKHDARGINMPNASGCPEHFVCGMNPSDIKRLGFTKGEIIRIIGEPGELETMVETADVPQGYITLYSGFANCPLAELGMWSRADIRVSLEKIA